MGAIALGVVWFLYSVQKAPSSIVPTSTRTAPVEQPSLANQQSTDQFAGWDATTDSDTTVVFKYPPVLGTQYISFVDWPPTLRILPQPFACTPAGNGIDRGGKTERRTVEGRVYCVTQIDEGAAGSVYSQYAYVFPRGTSTATLTFTLRTPECGNYDESERLACENERDAFKLDPLIDTIAQSIHSNGS